MSDYQHWYYINKNYEEDGPVSSDDLQRMAKTGDIHRGTYVWTQELAEWVPASKVGGLFRDEKPKDVVKPLSEAPLSKKTGGVMWDGQQKTEEPVQPKTRSATIKPLAGSSPDAAAPTPVPTPTPAEPQPQQDSAPVRANGPVPMTAPQSIVPKPLTSAHNLRQGQAPSQAGEIPKPLTAANPIPGRVPTSAQGLPQPLSSAQSIPAPPPAQASSIPAPQQTALPKAVPLPQPGMQPAAPIKQNPTSANPILAFGAAGANSIPAPQINQGSPGQPGQPPMPAPPGAPAPLQSPSGSLPSIPPVGRSLAPFNQTPTSVLQQADEEPKQRKAPRPMSKE